MRLLQLSPTISQDNDSLIGVFVDFCSIQNILDSEHVFAIDYLEDKNLLVRRAPLLNKLHNRWNRERYGHTLLLDFY